MRSVIVVVLWIAAPRVQGKLSDSSSSTWMDQLKCTADLESDQPSVIDETTCASRTDAASQPCLWCDLSSLIGSSGGLCVNSGIKDFLGENWEQLCSGDTGNQSPNGPEEALTLQPTKVPTPAPIVTPPAANPPADNSVDSFPCATDGSSQIISDEATCNSKVDATSSDGKNCVWCPLPLVGGGCITNSDASSLSWICRSFEWANASIEKGMKNLRGEKDISVNGWEIFDTACLGDTSNGLDEEKEKCGTRSDKTGNSCIWCDGAGAFGFCVSAVQKDVLGSYMNCVVETIKDATAVE